MALTETRRPYEFLARWNPQSGAFSGAHVQWIDVIERDGVHVGATPTKAFGVGEAQAFPLADILAQMHTDALAELDARAAQIAALTADKAAADQALAAAQAQVADLQAQLAVHLGRTTENGVPLRVTRRQAKTLMELTPHPEHGNLWLAALAAAEAIADPAARVVTRNYLTESQFFERDRVQQMRGLLGMTADQADALLTAAATA